MNRPLVSFVMPCYGYGRYLRDCMDGILRQTLQCDIEIIAINDCSPDDSLAILQWYAERDQRIRVINHEVNRGHIFTVNEGIAAARGKYLVRIDPDDRHHSCFLETLVPVLEADESIGLAHGNIHIIDDQGAVTVRSADTQHGGLDFTGNEFIPLLKKNFICAPTVLARREAWMAAWPVPEGLAFNDWYFNIMLARRWKFYYSDRVLADYRVHGSNHHSKVSADGSEERSVLRLLDMVYAQVEADPELEREKQAAKDVIYASQYMDFARKYFGHGMLKESRRCFMEAWRWYPRLFTQGDSLRLWAATFVSPDAYTVMKKWIKLGR